MPLPSGAKAVKEPWRLGLWIAYNLYGEDIKDKYPELLKVNWQLLIKLHKKDLMLHLLLVLAEF